MLKVVNRLTPTWATQIEKDIASHPNAPSQLNDSLQRHEMVEDDTAINITDEDTSQYNDTSNELDSINEDNAISLIMSLYKEMQQMKREREIERALMFEMWDIARMQNNPIDPIDDTIEESKLKESKDEKDQARVKFTLKVKLELLLQCQLLQIIGE